MKKTFALLTLLLAFLPSVVMAQTAKAADTKPSVKLVFAEDFDQIEITDPSTGELLPVDEGMIIPIGAKIVTNASTAELQLLPNKSILKLSAKTAFRVEALKDGATGKNEFFLQAGKIRAVAAKLTGATTKDPGYEIRTKTANCGVRGTDFAMLYDEAAQKDWVCVQEGLVDFTNAATGVTVPVATGQFANTFDTVFAAAVLSADKLAELFSDVEFVALSPLEVPGKEVPTTTQEASVETTPAEGDAVAEEKKPEAPAADDPMMEMLKKLFGLEVGSITIRGNTYSKAVMSPVVAFDGFKLGLYLPIVYTSDMFNPQDWYRPEGNNEWSFGSDKKGLWNKTADIANDLVLKIKYLEIGTQGADPFYLKLGNLKTMSLGHGTVVRSFANDQDFPAVRKVGLNAGVKLGPLALEGMADDIARASVVGGRLALDLIGDQVAVGVQAAADMNLANEQDLSAFNRTPASYGDPMLLVGGVDLQFFKINAGGVFRTTAFADANTMAVYYRQSPEENPAIKEGLNLTPFYHDGGFGSFGGETGLYGNILMVDYRLTFQAEKGLYTNGIFQGNYYRTRNSLLNAVDTYVVQEDTGADENLNMGVFGNFGFDIGLFSLEGAYRWPFELKDNGSIGPSENDSLKIKVDIPKDKIPFVALSGGISYERTQFVDSLVNGIDLFDANTVFKGEIVYGLAKGMDLVIGVGTMTQRDTDGSVIYQDGKPKVSPSVSLDTKLSL